MKKAYWIVWCIFLVGIVCTSPAQAMDIGFDSVPMSPDREAAYIENIDLETVAYDGASGGIRCFDVAQNGHYALGFGSDDRCNVYVYDASGAFLYGFRFCSVGDYGIQFCENSDYLAIYSIRAEAYAVFDLYGRCIDVQEVIRSEANTTLADEILSRKHKEISDKQYALERDINIGPEYSRFVVTNEMGERTVLFDKSADILAKQIIGIVWVLSFVALVICIAIKKSKEEGTW